MRFSFTSKSFPNFVQLTALIVVLITTACSVSPSVSSLPKAEGLESTSVPVDANIETGNEDSEMIVIAGPGTPSSIPLVLAAKQMNNTTVEIIENTSQANTAFLRGDIDILVSGLSVGIDLFRNGAPVQIVNTSVNGMSFLVTYGEKVNSFGDLKGKEIYIPFEGSPIEEAVSFLVKQEGLVWKEDIKPVYSPFDGSVALLKQGKAKAVVLPEPFVSMMESQSDLFVSLDLFAAWNEAAKTDNGYPQVAAFVRRDWAESHKTELAEFNAVLDEAVNFVLENPDEAVAEVKGSFKQPEPILLKAVSRMHYMVISGNELVQNVSDYYEFIGKPLDDRFQDFYYLP